MTPKEWRHAQGYTLDQLAEILGFGRSYLNEVENGVKGASLRLAQAYHQHSEGKVNLLIKN